MAEAAEASEETTKKGGNKLVIILMVVIIVLLLAVGGVVTWLLLSKSGHKEPVAGAQTEATNAQPKEEKPKGAPISIPLNQPITVNLNKPNDADLLQVELTLVTFDPKVDEMVKQNRAEIINDIMLILSDVQAAKLRTRDGKEALQKQLKDEINKVLLERSGKKDLIDNVFFTKLLMQ